MRMMRNYWLHFLFQCSVVCGKGIKTRTVFCGTWQDRAIHKVSDELCSQTEKMASHHDCYGEKCSASWFTGPWTRVWFFFFQELHIYNITINKTLLYWS